MTERSRLAARSPVAAGERVLVVTTVMIGTISTILAATIVNVAFPAMMQELRVGHDTVQWVSTGFLAATATTMPRPRGASRHGVSGERSSRRSRCS